MEEVLDRIIKIFKDSQKTMLPSLTVLQYIMSSKFSTPMSGGRKDREGVGERDSNCSRNWKYRQQTWLDIPHSSLGGIGAGPGTYMSKHYCKQGYGWGYIHYISDPLELRF